MELLKLLSTSEIVAQIASFLLLLFILRIFAWKHLLKLLDDRKEKIVSEFKKIEDARSEIEQVRGEYEERLRLIEETARTITNEAVTRGKALADDIIDNSEREAQNIIDNAKESIKTELSKAREELKNDIINLTISAAEKVVQEKITTDQDKKVIEDFLNNIDKPV